MLTRLDLRGTPEMRILIIEDDNETAAYLGKARAAELDARHG